ncbi:MAG: hypothetical protein OEW42_19585, partial [Acidimicrobiia bacterium]|nr:hypothetical protein [Acidimicrobiia bacterium]
SLDQRAEVVVHGDLHDKNVFCDTPRPADAAQLTATPLLADAAPLGGAGPLALIDLDGLGLGAPEDDVANLAVHLELRNLQARTGLPFGTRSGELYRSYQRTQPLDRERLEAVERHTWFRLACLYQYRVASRHLVPQLLRAARGDSGQRDGDLTATEGTLADVK